MEYVGPSLPALPSEVFLSILDCCDPKTLGRASLVSQAWRAVSEDDALWRSSYYARWPATGFAQSSRHREPACRYPPHQPDEDPRPWKEVFRLQSELERAWFGTAPRTSATLATTPRNQAGHCNGLMTAAAATTAAAANKNVRILASAPQDSHTKDLRCLSIRGDVIATGSYDARVHVWRRRDGMRREHRTEGDNVEGPQEAFPFELARKLAAHKTNVFAVAVDPEERFVLSGGGDCHLRKWDIADGTPTDIVPPAVAARNGNILAILPLGPAMDKVVTAGEGRRLAVWNTAVTAPQAALATFAEAHTSTIYTAAIDSELAPSRILTGDGEWSKASICWWDVHRPGDGPLRRINAAHSSFIVASQADERYAFTGSWDSAVKLWDTRTAGDSAVHEVKTKRNVNCLCYDNWKLVVGGQLGMLSVYDLRNLAGGKLSLSAGCSKGHAPPRRAELRMREVQPPLDVHANIWGVAFDEKEPHMLVVGCGSGSLKFFDLRNATQMN